MRVEVPTGRCLRQCQRLQQRRLSIDGIPFVELRTNITGEEDLKIAFQTQQHARYLKVELLDSAGGFWWRIDDFYVLQ